MAYQGLKLKEVSVSLGQKVSVNYQSKNAQVGVVIELNGEPLSKGYKTALNFCRVRLEDEVKRIREEML